MPSIVALIPARSGSQRIKDKNIKLLAGKPLIAYTIEAAEASGIFTQIVVSTDSMRYGKIAMKYGAQVPFLRPKRYAISNSPDIEWVRYTLSELTCAFDCFAILRPTSPFRTAATIQRAWGQFQGAEGVDSIRAVERCSQHPGKMWVYQYGFITPLLPLFQQGIPWHSTPYQSLPDIFSQNASLEIAWCRVAQYGSISGGRVLPLFTEGYEGFDINTQADWDYAEYLLEKGIVKL